jgi:hypothetical protein
MYLTDGKYCTVTTYTCIQPIETKIIHVSSASKQAQAPTLIV